MIKPVDIAVFFGTVAMNYSQLTKLSVKACLKTESDTDIFIN